MRPGHLSDLLPRHKHDRSNLLPKNVVSAVYHLPVVAGKQEEDQRCFFGAGFIYGADDEKLAIVFSISCGEVVHQVQPWAANPGLCLRANVDDVGVSST